MLYRDMALRSDLELPQTLVLGLKTPMHCTKQSLTGASILVIVLKGGSAHASSIRLCAL